MFLDRWTSTPRRRTFAAPLVSHVASRLNTTIRLPAPRFPSALSGKTVAARVLSIIFPGASRVKRRQRYVAHDKTGEIDQRLVRPDGSTRAPGAWRRLRADCAAAAWSIAGVSTLRRGGGDCASAVRTQSNNFSGANGLPRQHTMPALRARARTASSRWAVIRTMGKSSPDTMSRSCNSSPLTPGMRPSVARHAVLRRDADFRKLRASSKVAVDQPAACRGPARHGNPTRTTDRFRKRCVAAARRRPCGNTSQVL